MVLLKRVVVTPLLWVLGFPILIGGEPGMGLSLMLMGVAYWMIAGWLRRLGFDRRPARRRKPRPCRAQPLVTVAVVEHRTVSDGVGGAFARLHPDTRAWLMAEMRARDAG